MSLPPRATPGSVSAWGEAPSPAKPRGPASSSSRWICCHSLGAPLAGPKTRAAWRVRLGEAAEHPATHACMLLFIFLDVMAVFGEIMLRDVCPTPDEGASGVSGLYAWEDALSWVSRSILFALLVHQGVLILAFGRSFFQKWTYAVDFVIVVVALVLEMTHLGMELSHKGDAVGAHDAGHGDHDKASGGAHGPDDASSIIIVLLSWRVVRVIHGFLLTAEAHADDGRELNEARARVDLREAHARIEALEKEVGALRAASAGGAALPPPPPPLPPLISTLARTGVP